MAPLHHHFELGGWKETKVCGRFLDHYASALHIIDIFAVK